MQAMARTAFQGIITAVPDSRVDIRYVNQTVKDCIKTGLTEDRLAMTYGEANTYTFSVYVEANALREDVTRNSRMTVEKVDYVVLGTHTDQVGALIRIDLGEKYQ